MHPEIQGFRYRGTIRILLTREKPRLIAIIFNGLGFDTSVPRPCRKTLSPNCRVILMYCATDKYSRNLIEKWKDQLPPLGMFCTLATGSITLEPIPRRVRCTRSRNGGQ